LGNAFKEIYISDNVNNEAIIKAVMSQKIQKELIDARQNKKTLNVHFEAKFEMLNNEGESVIRYYRNVLNSVPSFNVINTLINDFYDSLNEQILISVNQSQLVFSSIKKITIRTTKINRRVGGSYIPLPEKVQNSNSCINVKNEDDRCFEYSILASKCFDLVSINGKTNPKVYKKN
jgi:GTP1/Obg family GTP-binding protein